VRYKVHNVGDVSVVMLKYYPGKNSGRGVAGSDCTIEGFSRTSNGPLFGAPKPHDGYMESRGAWFGDASISGKGVG
jgi:hypothetical protein